MVFSPQILGSRLNAFCGHGLVLATLAVLPGLLLLAGCGQKGPLYLAAPQKAGSPAYVAPPLVISPPLAPASAAR